MNNIKKAIIDEYYNKNYEKFLERFEEYVSHGYAVEFDLIWFYLLVLINYRKFDEVYKFLQKIEKDAVLDQTFNSLFILYIYCFKPKDAERLYLTKKLNIKDKSFIVRMYLLQGKVEEARNFINQTLAFEDNDKLRYYLKRIDNYYAQGAFIETEYKSFIANGNHLEPGHIVFLKNEPKSKHVIETDEKNNRRPYLICKIEYPKLYLFPVTTFIKKRDYKLYEQNYPNSIGDRSIKNNLCFTTQDNVLSVSDKVNDYDLNKLLTTMYQRTYMAHSKELKQANIDFMQTFHREVKDYDVIEYRDIKGKSPRYYLVLGIDKRHYKMIEIDYNELTVLGNQTETYSKDCLIYNLYKLSSLQKERLFSQINAKF